jgi:tetratricopeptide (TPR) repeat protein
MVMGQLLDFFIQWAKQGKRWPLLLLLLNPAAFGLVQQYFGLTFRETVAHGVYWILSGGIFVVSGILYWGILPRSRNRVLLGGALSLCGVVFLAGAAWRLEPPSLPEDRFVIAIARFVPVSPAAVDEASNLPHRIVQLLQEKADNGVPLTAKLLSQQIEGPDEETRHEAAVKLARSRNGNAHVIVWGEVRKDEGELYVMFRLTVGRPFRRIRPEERGGESVVSVANHLEFKQQLSSQIADLVTVIYGLAYYNAGDWDRAIEILGHASSDEGSLYRGLSRIRRYIGQFRVTLNREALLPELQKADSEISSGFNGFIMRKNLELASVCLINRGHIQRMQSRWDQAVSMYQQACALAEKGNNPGPKADALIGLAKAEMLGLRDHLSAEAHADQAVVLSTKNDDKVRLFDALSVKAEAQIYREDLTGAIETLKRVFAVAEKFTDKTSLVYAHLDRADVYIKLSEKCPLDGPIEVCNHELDEARADYTQALSLARKLRYDGLAIQTEIFLQEIEVRRKTLDLSRKQRVQR